MTKPDIPGVIAPPPLIFLAGISLGLVADWLLALPSIGLSFAFRIALAATAAIAGMAFAGLALRQFRAAGTPAEPWKPSAALTTHGVYRLTRNPMYLGMALVMLALAFGLASWGILAMLPVTMLVIDRFVIAREERYLEARFGAPYRQFVSEVRRWI